MREIEGQRPCFEAVPEPADLRGQGFIVACRMDVNGTAVGLWKFVRVEHCSLLEIETFCLSRWAVRSATSGLFAAKDQQLLPSAQWQRLSQLLRLLL